MKAAVVHDFTQPLSIEDVPRPEPSDGQVLVRIEACGLCHTDIHAAHGDWPIKPPLPLIPGHEGVGIVEALGPERRRGDQRGRPGRDPVARLRLRTLPVLQLGPRDALRGADQHRLRHGRRVRRVRRRLCAPRREGARQRGLPRRGAAELRRRDGLQGGQELRGRPVAAVRDLRRRRPGSPGGAVRQDPGRDRGRRRPRGRQARDGEGARRRLRGQRRRAGSRSGDPEAGRRRRRDRPRRGSQALRAGLRLAGPRRDADDGRPAARTTT